MGGVVGEVTDWIGVFVGTGRSTVRTEVESGTSRRGRTDPCEEGKKTLGVQRVAGRDLGHHVRWGEV